MKSVQKNIEKHTISIYFLWVHESNFLSWYSRRYNNQDEDAKGQVVPHPDCITLLHMDIGLHWSIHLYIYLEPKWHLFSLQKALFWRVEAQK